MFRKVKQSLLLPHTSYRSVFGDVAKTVSFTGQLNGYHSFVPNGYGKRGAHPSSAVDKLWAIGEWRRESRATPGATPCQRPRATQATLIIWTAHGAPHAHLQLPPCHRPRHAMPRHYNPDVSAHEVSREKRYWAYLSIKRVPGNCRFPSP